MTKAQDGRRHLPSVDSLLSQSALGPLLAELPRALVRRAVREVLEAERDRLARDEAAGAAAGGAARSPAAVAELVARAVTRARRLALPGLRRVVNATGIVVHTNLGRSPLGNAACAAVEEAARGYSTLEYDVEQGRRGSRLSAVRELLVELTGAEDALAVNNNAAALMLALSSLAAGREVVVSRGELVEIGGSFRLPAIMERSGARLVEVGTTNKTHAEDYRQAIGERTALLLKVHRSNFSMRGFVAEVELPELVAIGRERGVPVVEDLGSGALLDLGRLGVGPEPTVQASVKAGAQVVTFSGDKLLGGPQAGILVGEGAVIERLAGDPMTRALRLDKLSIAALEATLRAYLDAGRAISELPALRLLLKPVAELEQTARALAAAIEAARPDLAAEAIATRAQVGGGAQPENDIPSFGVALVPQRGGGVRALFDGLRRAEPPVVGRIEMDRLVLDVRALLEGDAEHIVAVLEAQGGGGDSR